MFKKYFSLNLIILILFILDRLLKFWFLQNPDFTRDFIVGILSFRLETNLGIAFGFIFNQMFLLALVIVIIFFLLDILLKVYLRRDLLVIFSLTLIIVGAISNLLDRLRYGFVIDYIDVSFFTVFNLADIMITGGIIILASHILLRSKKKSKNN